MITIKYNRNRKPGEEELFAFYRPDQEPDAPLIPIGVATKEEGLWRVRVIQGPEDDIVCSRQAIITSCSTQADAALALLCAESHVEAVLK